MVYMFYNIWLVVTGTMEFGLTCHSVGNFIIPTDLLTPSFFRGVGSTTKQFKVSSRSDFGSSESYDDLKGNQNFIILDAHFQTNHEDVMGIWFSLNRSLDPVWWDIYWKENCVWTQVAGILSHVKWGWQRWRFAVSSYLIDKDWEYQRHCCRTYWGI